ncbi:MAG: 3'-5' exonuclease, partial [Candidatus Aminicenantales bacterium]
AILVLTIHQAKGLEFPVVVLWDGFAKIGARTDGTPWKVMRDGNWAIQIEGLKAGSKPGRSLIEQERTFEKEEKKRLYYVAATRARDLLVVPVPNQGKNDKVSHILAGDLGGEAVLRMEEFKPGDLPEWAKGVSEAPAFPEIKFANARAEKDLKEGWKVAAGESARPVAVPTAVTMLAKAKEEVKGRPAARGRGRAELAESRTRDLRFSVESPDETTDLSGEREAKKAVSRFGPEFGLTVHAALSAILRGGTATIEKVVRACAARSGLENHSDDAVKDVRRAIDTLKKMGLLAGDVARFAEYPVVASDDQGRLITGYIDLVASAPDCTWIIDFKTDPVPEGPLELSYPDYLRQIGLYKDLLGKTTGIKAPIRAGLLFSADGRLAS